MLKKVLLIVLTTILIIIIGLTIFLYMSFKSGNLQKFIINKVIEKTTGQNSVSNEQSEVLQKVLGFTAPQHYLMLFLNNTELRPGGGFIGSYGVVKIENGKPEILKVEGTETLDGLSPEFESVPPIQLAKHLKIETWKFRDSNWSPDFGVSTQKALELYEKEKGLAYQEIDAVIAVTPTVFESILKIIGPVSMDGIEFNYKNFTEKLEYEVEYGYAEKGIDFRERKDIMGRLSKIILPKFVKDVALNWQKYYELFEDMIMQRQVMFYSKDSQIQDFLEVKKWSPKVEKTNGDYLLWVDSNLGAWKTDFSMERELEYKISPTESGRFLGEVKMKYNHTGKFDWRTTRYLTYSRVYLPVGSEFIEVVGGESVAQEYAESNFGKELGKDWFGMFFRVEPGTSKELIFRFYLSEQIVKQIKDGEYNLLVQKQLGSLDHDLTLSLDMGNNVLSAKPAEIKEYWGDSKYSINTDLLIDRVFNVKLKK